MQNKKQGWLHEILFFLGILAILFVVFKFVIGFAVIDGESMEPTLQEGDIVFYFRIDKTPHTGEMVAVWVPSGEYYIKRVVAEGGDIVSVKKGILYINDEAGDEYGQGDTRPMDSGVIYPYRIRENNYFILGDNRENSKDSRTFGEVSRTQIYGRVFYVYKR